MSNISPTDAEEGDMKCCCAICLNRIDTPNLSVTTCNHSFHDECIWRWLERSNTCPKCRTRMPMGMMDEDDDYIDEIVNLESKWLTNDGYIDGTNSFLFRWYDHHIDEIVYLLKNSVNVVKINLESNDIGDAGASALADALKVNTTLTEINLGSNEIGDDGASALADALKVNTTLTKIVLCCNPIGDAGASALADALKVNTTLTEIYLG